MEKIATERHERNFAAFLDTFPEDPPTVMLGTGCIIVKGEL